MFSLLVHLVSREITKFVQKQQCAINLICSDPGDLAETFAGVKLQQVQDVSYIDDVLQALASSASTIIPNTIAVVKHIFDVFEFIIERIFEQTIIEQFFRSVIEQIFDQIVITHISEIISGQLFELNLIEQIFDQIIIEPIFGAEYKQKAVRIDDSRTDFQNYDRTGDTPIDFRADEHRTGFRTDCEQIIK